MIYNFLSQHLRLFHLIFIYLHANCENRGINPIFLKSNNYASVLILLICPRDAVATIPVTSQVKSRGYDEKRLC